ncbi:hypothetical protein MKW98_030045 [Papaver atlanticum]|uniref:Formin-like protein n=1 Tax=Papaver atlanticum TaxID=357466 RepID=A0AAD4XPP8_9MAGN|nr:hypothetical protein MKW98_030045 [Papaver atlanticum]
MAAHSSYSLLQFFFIVLLFSTVNSSKIHPHHRILHQPFYPIDASPPPSELPSADSPIPEYQTPPEPKYPFSSLTPPSNPFFPDVPSTPSPPQTPPATSATFPANISSLIFPQSPLKQSASPKYVAIAVILSLFSTAFIISIILLIYKRKHFTSDTKTSRSDSHRLFPTYNPSSNVVEKLPPARTRTVSNTSTEFLYLGTLANAHGLDSDSVHSSNHNNSSSNNGGITGNSSKMSSPELRPLPKLARQNFSREFENVEVGVSAGAGGNEDLDEEFYSPRGSNVEKLDTGSDSRRGFSGQLFDKRRKTSTNSGNLSYPSSNSGSSTSNSPSPPHKSMAAPPPPPPPPPPLNRPMTPSPPKRKPPSPSPPSPSSPPAKDFPQRNSSPVKMRTNGLFRYPGSVQAPVPPPPPPAGYWETQISRVQMHEQEMLSRQQQPPVLITPSRPVMFQSIAVSPVDVSQNVESVERNEETPKPKLKPLHWDKVRASSDKTMVWDQLRSSSFQLNEEMIESLFIVNNNGNTNVREGGGVRPGGLPSPNQENRVLDPKKSQNISILLRALNVTIEEVCEALLEGNTDTLGTDLLESLLKMAPSKEEERKLKEYKDDSPFKLGTAERFLKALVDVPFAFKRVDALLYIANFDSEVEYLRKSFITLEAACEELRNSRMFLKLLEAVLKTGNRMNVGTNRGDAHAFKLDTLLKLVDVKGTDGKTTLLHFVVQEIIRAEVSRRSGPNQKTDIHNDVEFRKRGLEVVSSISGELANVKKSATMDSDVLSSDVSKLARGLSNIGEVMRLNESTSSNEYTRRFAESMNSFMKKAELEIIRIQAQESVALSVVKEITEYFHGNSTKEEAHPFRIFLVVRDFLSVLDRVCKEVGKINERTIVSSARQFPVPVNPTQPTVFPVSPVQPQYSSSEDESSSSSS